MLIRLSDQLTTDKNITIQKYNEKGTDVSLQGAFSIESCITWEISPHRAYGVQGVVMRIARDGEESFDIPFVWREDGSFILSLSMQTLCGEIDNCLFYYRLVLLRGTDVLYMNPFDNVHFYISANAENLYRLLVHNADFTTPSWFYGGVMYHIFVDRFYKSGKVVQQRKDALYASNWNGPITQYGAYPGAHVQNNEFFGGDLWGIIEKLPYLRSLGVTVLYLSPIFKAYSNHKYDTGDYRTVDDQFGGREALDALIRQAKKYGMRIILDGVFNHTGDDSLYFDRYGNYEGVGAFGNPSSPYRGWYYFGETDTEYDCWWGIKILPKLNHNTSACQNFFTGEEGVGAQYVSAGIGGWRLDVADELSDTFLDAFRRSVKEANADAIIIGEVWENAADKIAYGKRRRYFCGAQLDSVMNYPLRQGILAFMLEGNGAALAGTLTEIYSSYPKCVCDCLMNILGTHDTERILSVLGDSASLSQDNTLLATYKMDNSARQRGIRLLRLASIIQFTVYGVPSVFYGDEAGIEGGHDPFCRKPFPWGSEEEALQAHYRLLGSIRRHPIFATGDFQVLEGSRNFICYTRFLNGARIYVAVNLSDTTRLLSVQGRDLLTGKNFTRAVPPESGVILLEEGAADFVI
ncbi:MAG: glycoside hydrolase family 13 protein [Clostridiales bacterium]|jgi:cyclomaltodextrinase|nr:glycoside hydrolase family 13 protein [Clostridiales bacterium]